MKNSPEEYGAFASEKPEFVYWGDQPYRKLGRGAMNCHHLFWTAKNHHDWMRAEPDFQPQMYIPAHNALHSDLQAMSVPEICKPILQAVRANFTPTRDTFDSLDQILLLIDHASEMPQVHPIDRQLAQMAIHALEIQKPYLKGNIAPNRAIVDRNYNDYVRGYK